MPKEKNTPIGEVPCAHRGCDLKAHVYKFRSTAQHEWQRRHAGKLYSCCDKGHRCEDQEYLLGHATIWGKKDDEPAPVADQSAPVQTPEKTAPAPVRRSPARTSPAPAGKSTPVPAAAPGKKGWGWFQ